MRISSPRSAVVALALAGCGGNVIVGVSLDGAATDSPVVDAPLTDTSRCLGSQLRCGGRCVDTRVSPFHCGACGVACASGGECFDGACVRACVAPSLQCGAACVDPSTDVANCGACGRACPPGATCRAGRCRAPTDVTYAVQRDALASASWVDACNVPGSVSMVPSIDDASSLTRLPFALPFWGTVMPAGSPVNVCSNGWIGLDGLMNNALSGTVPSEASPDGVVAGFWSDIVTGPSGVCVATVGAAPMRRVAYEWHDVTFFGARDVRATFEAVLHETGLIELLYRDVPSGRTAGAGIENLDGSDGVSLCGSSTGPCAVAAGTRVRFTPSR